MNKFITAIGLLILLALPLSAQNSTNIINVEQTGTNAPVVSGPLKDFWDAAKMTNVIAIGYGELNLDDTSKVGGGIAIGYHLSDFVVPFIRGDYSPDGTISEVSATAQLQLPVTLFGKVTAIPLTYVGTGTALGGKGVHNGDIFGVLGAGLAVRLGSRVDLLSSYEIRTGSGIQEHLALFGVGVKFGSW